MVGAEVVVSREGTSYTTPTVVSDATSLGPLDSGMMMVVGGDVVKLDVVVVGFMVVVDGEVVVLVKLVVVELMVVVLVELVKDFSNSLRLALHSSN